MDPYQFYTTITALNDIEAKAEFERIRKLPELGYDELYMERIDVEEKVTFIT
jgi:hypothetical protein